MLLFYLPMDSYLLTIQLNAVFRFASLWRFLSGCKQHNDTLRDCQTVPLQGISLRCSKRTI